MVHTYIILKRHSDIYYDIKYMVRVVNNRLLCYLYGQYNVLRKFGKLHALQIVVFFSGLNFVWNII